MSVKQLGRKRFLLDFRTTSGKRIRRIIEGPRSLAEKIFEDIEVKKYKREFLGIIELEKIRLKDFVEKYIRYAYTNKCRKEAYTEERAFKSKIVPFLGVDSYLTEITPYMIEKFKSERLKKVSPSTVNRNVQYLKHAFKMASEWGYLKDNPAETIKKLKEPPGRIRWARPIEIEELLKPANERLKKIILFDVNTGLRSEELKQLKRIDIITNSVDNEIFSDVHFKNLDYTKGGIFVRASKNNTQRMIPMNDIVLEIVKSLPFDNEYVFGGKGWRDAFEYAREKAKISDFRFHDLRHTFASYLVMKGVDIRTVQFLMGHKDIKMTMRYSHLSKGHIQEAVDKLNGIFNLDTFWTDGNKKELEGVKGGL
jgi:integrase